MTGPVLLPPNGVARFFRGGQAIAALRGKPEPGAGDLAPEDWVASTTEAFGEPGAGVRIVELQEPGDMAVMVEWRGHGIGGEREATLGLGWDAALACVERTPRDPAPLAGPPRGGAPGGRALPALADPFFTAAWLT